jgi:glutamyl endopeptidase
MTRYQCALAFSLLAALPLASTASAQKPNRPMASDGSVTAVMESSSSISPSYAGSPDLAPEANQPPRVLSAAERAKLATYKPIGPPGPQKESVIGADNRVPINNTTRSPYRKIALITFNTPSGGSRCTGWFINATTIVTSGHCVHRGIGGASGFYSKTSYTIYPAYTGSSAPYGTCTAKRLHTVEGWSVSGLDDYDYGAIKLNCSVGNTTGWFGYFATTAPLLNFTTRTSGYPGDKPYTQWYSKDFVRATDARRVFYKNDTYGGQSGSPVWASWQLCNECALAVHGYGANTANNNHGTRITQAVVNNFNTWKNTP